MSERYARLFALPENQYMEGAPVIIAAGALLRDNKTGGVLALLSLGNVSSKPIRELTVRVAPLDAAGRPLGESVEFQYADLDEARDTNFGQRQQIAIPHTEARAFTASVTEVVFTDATTWTAGGGSWETIPLPEPLRTKLNDPELVRQFRLRYGEDCEYEVREFEDLWFCACGALNRREEEQCHVCGKALLTLKDADWEALRAERDERLRQQRQQAEEAEQKTAEARAAGLQRLKQRLRRAGLAAAGVAVLIGLIFLLTHAIRSHRARSDYEEGLTLMESGEYAAAAERLLSLGDYEDSAEQARVTLPYLAAARYLEAAGKNDGTLAEEARELPDTLRALYEEAQPAPNAADGGTDGLPLAPSPAKDPDREEEPDLLTYEEIGEDPVMLLYAAAEELLDMAEGHEGVGLLQSAVERGRARREAELWDAAYEARYAEAIALDEAGDLPGAMSAYASLGEFEDALVRLDALLANFRVTTKQPLAAGTFHTVAVRRDGTVLAVGDDSSKQCDVGRWTRVVSVAAGYAHTLGLRSDGTVVAAGSNEDGRCDVGDWHGVIAISASNGQSFALLADGTVVSRGYNENGQCNVSRWHDIVAISAGSWHTVGLRSDGAVVSVGDNRYGQRNVLNWTDITAVAAGKFHTVGLRSDGTVVAAGNNDYGQCDVWYWTDIVAIAVGQTHTVGLRSDGTVVTAGSSSNGRRSTGDWTDIVAIAADNGQTFGLRSDGTVLATGYNSEHQCDVEAWRDIMLPESGVPAPEEAEDAEVWDGADGEDRW